MYYYYYYEVTKYSYYLNTTGFSSENLSFHVWLS